MEKVTIKDINEIKKQLSFGKRIKVAGKKVISIPKRGIQKMKDWYGRKKAALYGYTEDVWQEHMDKKAEKIDEKIEKIDERLEPKLSVYEKYVQDPRFQEQGSVAETYINALAGNINTLENKQNKLRDKKVKINSKSPGLFRASVMALGKLGKAKWGEIQERRAQKKAARAEQKKQEAIYNEAATLCDGRNSITMQMDEMLRQYEALKQQMAELQKLQNAFASNYGMSPEEYVNTFGTQEVVDGEILDGEVVETPSAMAR